MQLANGLCGQPHLTELAGGRQPQDSSFPNPHLPFPTVPFCLPASFIPTGLEERGWVCILDTWEGAQLSLSKTSATAYDSMASLCLVLL